MKTNILFLITFFCLYNSLQSQSFVNNSNKWFVDDCFSSILDGTITCTTSQYDFGTSITIDSLEYKELISNNQNPAWPIAKYYREENGKIYARDATTLSEFLIYDFTAEEGDQIEIGGSIFGFWIEVLSIDSIALNSGEKRKRMEVALASAEDIKTYWIEGIGGESSPLDSRYMFAADAWIELSCYFENSIVEYSLKDCELTNSVNLIPQNPSKLIIYPNPSTEHIRIEPTDLIKIDFIDILDTKGNIVVSNIRMESQKLNIKHLPSGIYLLQVTYENGSHQVGSFVKK